MIFFKLDIQMFFGVSSFFIILERMNLAATKKF